ncbi:MAG TPA: ATP-binding protein [Planctomycetaceae bacterium]|nr:ATP-binding protein [Planctomycetaceae bacterium]
MSEQRSADDLERRLVIFLSTNKDAVLTRDILARAQIACCICPTLESVIQELARGAGALLLAEEGLIDGHALELVRYLQQQPPWSDLPILFLTRHGADSPVVMQAMNTLGNVTLLERPTRVNALISTARAALRARERQFQVREHLIEREQIAEALKRADRRKDEFLATLAHELRNPLAPIRNSLHILQLAEAKDATAARLYEVMERQLSHLVRLVDDLLELSRITRGQIELRRKRVELAAIVRSAVETSSPLIDAARHQLAISLPTEPILLDVDPVRMVQVISNLLNNAAKYTNNGGQIWLSARVVEGQAMISVRDTGIGIPLDMQSRVFEMFAQVDRSAGRSYGGLGIGLTLVRSLVEMHGGSVEVKSDGDGHGSEFTVRLPLAAQTVASSTPVVSGRISRVLSSQRILVVDDNCDSADSLRTLLTLLGAEVEVAYSGIQALSTIEEFHPAVVLLDLGMPEMDGYEVAERIRQRTDFHDVTLIALTGWGQDEDRRRARHAGFDHHLVKPADITSLQALLASHDGP